MPFVDPSFLTSGSEWSVGGVGQADGTASDPTTAVVAVERAQLAMQLASQLRTKGVEALQDIFHTQV